MPKPVSKYVDQKLTNFGWDAAEGFVARGRSVVSDGAGNFVNGFISYSGAPMTYSPQYESYRDEDYKGPGWKKEDAFSEGIEEVFKGSASSSKPVESLKSVSFDVDSRGGGLDVGGMVRDASILSVGSSGVLLSGGVLFDELKGSSDDE